jgi:hypothetical protein
MLFHANLLYAEFPLARIGEMVEKSYIPVLETILSGRVRRTVFDITGITLELLAGEHPDIYSGKPEALSLIREGVAAGKIEITGTSWAHAVLPTLPLPLQEEDIALFKRTASRLLGVTPVGFFPPELGISPLLPDLLRRAGYRYCFADRELVEFSRAGLLNDYNDFRRRPESVAKRAARALTGGLVAKARTLAFLDRRLRTVTDWSPVLWQGAGQAALPLLTLDAAWITWSLLSFSRAFFLSERQLARRLGRVPDTCRGFLFPYSSDVEFFGLGGNTLNVPIPVSRISAFYDRLEERGVEISLPGAHPEEWEGELVPVYCRAGSWSTDKDFALWQNDPDNRVLDDLALTAYRAFQEKADGLSPETREAVLKQLLLSFNSDGRGWTPVPEHRLFCFNRARRVLEELAGR